MKDYDAYLFDMDGTVVRTFDIWLAIVRETLARYDIEVDKKVIVRKVFGRAPEGLSELGVPESDLPEIFKEWGQKAGKMMLQADLYDGIDGVLKSLTQKGKKLALITSTVRPTVEVILANRGLKGVFNFEITGDEMEVHKPDPSSLLVAIKQLGVEKDRVVMLGDSEKDIRAANNAGIDSVLFFPPEHHDFHTLEELQADNPTYTIASWQELLK